MPCRAKPEDIAVSKTNKDLPVPAELMVTWGEMGINLMVHKCWLKTIVLGGPGRCLRQSL